MKLEGYSIDDLHQVALAEFEDDAHAVCALNVKYRELLANYIALFQSLREREQS